MLKNLITYFTKIDRFVNYIMNTIKLQQTGFQIALPACYDKKLRSVELVFHPPGNTAPSHITNTKRRKNSIKLATAQTIQSTFGCICNGDFAT